jgi:Domain of unknown function (DUF4157)
MSRRVDREVPVGNQAMLRRLSRTGPHPQCKLEIGAVNDPLEAEADSVADQVMRMPEPGIASADAPQSLQRKCASCEEEDQKAASRLARKQTNGGAAGLDGRAAPPIVEEVLASPGQPLDAATRAFFEPRLGQDISQVRLHTDSKAAESARSVNALAYTVGNHITLRDGHSAAEGDPGRWLLAHELAHTVQQNAGVAAPRPASPASSLRRQAGGMDDDQKAPDSSPDKPPDPSYSVILNENLFVEDDETSGGQAANASSSAVVRRAPADIPPPPPAFPSVYEWYFDIAQDAQSLFGLTCTDGRERGFYVMWNESSKKSFAGPIAIGDPAVGCTQAHIELGAKPGDKRPIFPVGWFHTHPLANKGCRKLTVGPSDLDKQTSKDLGLPGMAEDTKTPNAPCSDAGSYFFGPIRRSYY